MRLKIASTFLILALTLLSAVAYGMSDKNSRGVVFLPFDVKKAGSYAVLGDGLRDMLVSRLAQIERIAPLENTLSREEQEQFLSKSLLQKKKVFEKLNTDFIAVGSMVALGEALNINVDFYPKDGTETLHVSRLLENEQHIIDGIDELARDISENVFGNKKQSASTNIVVNSGGIEAFQTEHPDKKYKKEVISGPGILDSKSKVSIVQGELVRRKMALPDGIISLSVEDGDGDGRSEIFVTTKRNLQIFHYERGTLKRLAEYVFTPSINVHALNVADLEGDGIAEIYISATIQNNFSSLILSWTPEKGIQEKIKNIRWAIRPIMLSGKDLALIGQSKSNRRDVFLEQGVYRLNVDVNIQQISRGEKLFLPGGVKLFDFVLADLDGDASLERIVIQDDLKMAVYDQDNILMWVSEKEYGGSINFLGERWQQNNRLGTNLRKVGDDYVDLQYVPVQLIAKDVNNDGKTDILAVKNERSSYKVFSNTRSFSGGNVVCLGWDNSQMVALWESDKLGGYVADYTLQNTNDINGSAVADKSFSKSFRLYVGQIPNEGFSSVMSFTGKKGNLYIYDFNIIEKNKIQSEKKE